MRLLDARALIHEGISRLVDDREAGFPPYAILSHTWSIEEVIYEDIAKGVNHEILSSGAGERRMQGYRTDSRETDHSGPLQATWARWCEPFFPGDDDSPRSEQSTEGELCRECADRASEPQAVHGLHVKVGWKKVYNACLKACQDEYDYIWIDTCCIDKASSAELSEAINSMFEWYAYADICYVYLDDCRLCPKSHTVGRVNNDDQSSMLDGCTQEQIKACRWLTRGWTLQELIAPPKVAFLDRAWQSYPPKSVESLLPGLTGVPRSLLGRAQNRLWAFHYDGRKGYLGQKRRYLHSITMAEKFSWASSRETTRVEDRAYSLLGLLDLNMPLIYGEGGKAFIRLQEELLKTTTDHSILAWEFPAWIPRPECERDAHMLLAPSPDYFAWLSRRGRSGGFNDRHAFVSKAWLSDNRFVRSFALPSGGLQLTLPVSGWPEEKSFVDKAYQTEEISDASGSTSEPTLSSSTMLNEEVEDDDYPDMSLDERLPSRKSSASWEGERYLPPGMTTYTSQALLDCNFTFYSNEPFYRVSMRLRHWFLHGTYVYSKILHQKESGGNEVLNRYFSWGGYQGQPETRRLNISFMGEWQDAQSLILLRDRDAELFWAL